MRPIHIISTFTSISYIKQQINMIKDTHNIEYIIKRPIRSGTSMPLTENNIKKETTHPIYTHHHIPRPEESIVYLEGNFDFNNLL